MLNGDQHTDKRAILSRHEFFEGLPDRISERVAARARTVVYEEGRAIFAKGDQGRSLFAVVDGTVKINVVSEDGREIVLGFIKAGEIFGEVSLFDGEPRTADATALTDCRLIVLDRREFIPILHEEPLLALRLLAVLSKRLRRTSRQVEALRFETLGVRLGRALLGLARSQGTADQLRPCITITQKELAHLVGVSRESTNKHLRHWEKAGLVSLGKGGCTILDAGAFGRLIEPGEQTTGLDVSPPGPARRF